MRALLCMLGLLAMLPPSTVQAQEQQAKPKSSKWITAGLQFPFWEHSSLTPYFHLFGVNVSYSFGRSVYHQVRVNAHALGLGADYYVSYASYSRGIGSVGRFHIVTVFAGPMFVWGKGESKRFYRAGLSGNMQAVFLPVKHLGFGVDVYGGISPGQSVLGVGVVFVMGGKM